MSKNHTFKEILETPYSERFSCEDKEYVKNVALVAIDELEYSLNQLKKHLPKLTTKRVKADHSEIKYMFNNLFRGVEIVQSASFRLKNIITRKD